MKVLFIINMEDLGFEEPLGVLYLSAVCKKNNHEVYAVNNNLCKIEDKIKAVKPDLLAVSVLTPSFPYLFENIKKTRARYNIPTVFGGPHATFFPEIVKSAEIDYVFMGECEEAFVEFLNLLDEGKTIDGVSNLVFIDGNGQVRQNPVKPLIGRLEDLPFPDRDLFVDYEQFYKADVKSIIAGRGCPYNCSYCFNDQYHKMYEGLGKTMRVRSVDNIVEECLELKHKYKARMLHFFDDIFPYQKDWLKEFAEKYTRKVDLPFFTNTRFDTCSEEYIKDLSMAGCKTLLIGVETGNEELRKMVLKRRMTNKMMIEKARMIHSYGIKIYTQNIIGLPYGSLEKDFETLKLNIDLKADLAQAYTCQPYPKTEIERMAREAGLLDDTFEIGRSFYYPSPLKLPYKKEMDKLRIVFSIIVNFPFLYGLTRILLKFPDYPLKLVSSFLHGYKVKTVVLRYKMSIRVFLVNVKMFFARKINSAFGSEG
jgi:anaerobic magnesium-protoporphyrin IX monomethyl ester cyclase